MKEIRLALQPGGESTPSGETASNGSPSPLVNLHGWFESLLEGLDHRLKAIAIVNDPLQRPQLRVVIGFGSLDGIADDEMQGAFTFVGAGISAGPCHSARWHWRPRLPVEPIAAISTHSGFQHSQRNEDQEQEDQLHGASFG